MTKTPIEAGYGYRLLWEGSDYIEDGDDVMRELLWYAVDKSAIGGIYNALCRPMRRPIEVMSGWKLVPWNEKIKRGDEWACSWGVPGIVEWYICDCQVGRTTACYPHLRFRRKKK